MSSQAGNTREEERRLSVRTLVIASAASAMAAIVTSQFWIAGTPIAAAITPVIVTLVSELLHRPSQRIVQRFTTEADAQEDDPRPAREPPARSLAAGEPEFRVYRTSRTGTSRTRRLPWKAIAVTATIAFVVGMAALTLPELIAGQSLGAGDRKSTLFGGRSGDREEASPSTMPEPEPEESVPGNEPGRPTTPETQPAPEQTTPSTPEQTTPPPVPQSTAPQVPPPR